LQFFVRNILEWVSVIWSSRNSLCLCENTRGKNDWPCSKVATLLSCFCSHFYGKEKRAPLFGSFHSYLLCSLLLAKILDSLWIELLFLLNRHSICIVRREPCLIVVSVRYNLARYYNNKTGGTAMDTLVWNSSFLVW
jgi:hypothetical protein